MNNNPKNQDGVSLCEGKASLKVFLLKDGRDFEEIDVWALRDLTPNFLCSRPFLFEFDTPEGSRYFAGTIEIRDKLASEGKCAQPLVNLFKHGFLAFVRRGFPPDHSFKDLTLRDLMNLRDRSIHQGVEVRQ